MKKGFTLVELLAAITIIAIIGLIAVPNIVNSIKNNNIDSYESVINDIKLAAETYVTNKGGVLVQIPVSKLYQEGYINNMKNPIDNSELNGCVYNINGEYTYKEEACETVITGITYEDNTCNVALGTEWTFDYNGINGNKPSVQEFQVPCDGKYKIEVWGAQGSTKQSSYRGGYGAYASGDISLVEGSKLYVFVGQQYVTGGYNGGGVGGKDGNNGGGGGGATDIRYFPNEPSSADLAWNSNVGLNSRIIVAAGGGGAATRGQNYGDGNGGAGGGLYGYVGQFVNHANTSGYETQPSQTSSGSISISFGGGTISYSGSFGFATLNASSYVATGGGSGYYGGTGAGHMGGSGGSSYISGHTGCVAIAEGATNNPRTVKIAGCSTGTSNNECSIHYSGLYFSNTKMIDGDGYSWTNTKGSLEQMPNPRGGKYVTGGNTGNGYAKITYVSK